PGTRPARYGDTRDLGARIGQDLLLGLGIDPQLGITLGKYCVTRIEERVLGCFEPCPQLVLTGPVGSTAGLPPLHQVAVGPSGGSPVGGVLELLGLGDELFLRSAYFLTLLVEFGEVGLATLGARVSRRRHALPQRLLGRAVGPRRTLPLLDELEHSLPTGLPVRRFHGDSLSLGDDAFLDLSCLIACLLLGLLLLDLALFRAAHELIQPSAQCVQVTDRVGLVDRDTQLVD